MSRLLDVPWVVNQESERISTHGGLGSIDFNGAEKERREAMRLVAQAQAMARILLRHAAGYGGHNCPTTAQECDVCKPIEDVLNAAGLLAEGA